METSGLEFEFFLADKKCMTVARLRREMSAKEFMEWGVYYGREAQKKQLQNMTR